MPNDPTAIYLTEGDDTYKPGSLGVLFPDLYALGGDDVIQSSALLGHVDGGAGDDIIYGAFERGGIDGGSGDDTIYGAAGRSTVSRSHLDGGSGDDHIIQRGGAADISGGSGDDLIELGTAYCNLKAGSGDDRVVYQESYAISYKGLDLGSADDVVDGSGSFSGSPSQNTNYVITTFGRGGDDLVIAGAGRDVFDGGRGIDEISYAHERSAVTINLRTGATGGAAAHDTLSRVENVTGTSFDDRIAGDSHDNVLTGGAGADRLYGGRGDDRLIGGEGVDRLRGGAGADIFAVGHQDVIADFHARQGDRLDFSVLFDNLYVRTIQPETPADLLTALHQERSGANLFVTADLSGDGVDDFALTLLNVHALHARDIVV
ncbi:calcium-binding protein [Hansschlegelia quercus]|uniref:Type I secretion C-terminal target domain-containing protein n=1 Tax=Hansschlegelia quercus TaxID=2528245 RepID=A0A4Q9GGS7_9HYPH|nr:type I secretion C-terminal target domain-containing protein [Hansschlegelia quercus]TBN53323.1 type I secretion C-terminal target domain-containing protein [Hansschlegelia quercus]